MKLLLMSLALLMGQIHASELSILHNQPWTLQTERLSSNTVLSICQQFNKALPVGTAKFCVQNPRGGIKNQRVEVGIGSSGEKPKANILEEFQKVFYTYADNPDDVRQIPFENQGSSVVTFLGMDPKNQDLLRKFMEAGQLTQPATLYIHGSAGVGKSHLLYALWVEFECRDPKGSPQSIQILNQDFNYENFELGDIGASIVFLDGLEPPYAAKILQALVEACGTQTLFSSRYHLTLFS